MNQKAAIAQHQTPRRRRLPDRPLRVRPGVCRICGCSDFNACVPPTGVPCHWVQPDLCSNCAAFRKARVRRFGAKRACMLIRNERWRQIAAEGFDAKHDDVHDDGALLRAAVMYLWHGTTKAAPGNRILSRTIPLGWPWEPRWWKPKGRKRNLVRAGALCLAEYDRRSRARAATGPAEHKLLLSIDELAKKLRAKARRR